MKRILIFAGTTEGRELAAALDQEGVPLCVSVATEYGRELLRLPPRVQTLDGRLDREQMGDLISAGGFCAVVDATHPYADQATANIGSACEGTGVPYVRLLREDIREPEQGIIQVESMEDAAAFLDTVGGNALLATGSKELGCFTAVRDYQHRLYPRVLPTMESLGRCRELGFPADHIICMQGPFSKELNKAMLQQVQAKYLVTKASGTPGGYREKVEAAKEAGAGLIVIARPTAETGLSFSETLRRALTLAGGETL